MPRVKIEDRVDSARRTLYSRLEIKHALMTDKGMYVCRGPDDKPAGRHVHILDGMFIVLSNDYVNYPLYYASR